MKSPTKAGRGRPPGSKNRATADIQDLAREYTAEALKTLTDVMGDTKAPAAARVAAANILLDRGYGKAPQAIAHSGPDGGPLKLAVEVVIIDRRKDTV